MVAYAVEAEFKHAVGTFRATKPHAGSELEFSLAKADRDTKRSMARYLCKHFHGGSPRSVDTWLSSDKPVLKENLWYRATSMYGVYPMKSVTIFTCCLTLAGCSPPDPCAGMAGQALHDCRWAEVDKAAVRAAIWSDYRPTGAPLQLVPTPVDVPPPRTITCISSSNMTTCQ